MKKLLYLIPFLAIFSQAGDLLKVPGSNWDEENTTSVNRNFVDIDNEFDNTVHKTSTETIKGNKTFTGLLRVPSSATPRTSVVPSGPGCMIRDSTANVMCWSTGTAVNSWVLFTSTTTPCPN